MMQWGDIVLIVGICAVFVYLAINQRNKMIEWLKYAVSEAEKMLGSGTGKLKLRLVYDRFVKQFPVAAAIVPFAVFSLWVDIALGTMRKWLGENKNVADYLGGE